MSNKTGSFEKRAKAQQAVFRNSLSIAARSPTDPKGQKHPHLLALGYEIENLYPEADHATTALEFFRERGIQWWNHSHSGDSKSKSAASKPTRNLASSQVCCVNFLLPLASIPGALLAFLRFLDPDVEEIVPIPDGQGHTSLVEFEWVGWQNPLEGGRIIRGALQTSADALIVGRTRTGQRAFLFEWKYLEQYRSARDKTARSKTAGATLAARYQSRFQDSSSGFNQAAPFKSFLTDPFYQLMRLQLLADEIVKNKDTKGLLVDDASVVVVCPQANEAYRQVVRRTPLGTLFPQLSTVEEIMRAVLKKPERFLMPAQEQIVAHLRSGPLARELALWLSYHHRRYGW